jgi:hypothetical protein
MLGHCGAVAPARTHKWVAVWLVLGSLGCQAEPRPSSYIEITEIFTIRHEVEIGPLHPDRVGPLIEGYDAPIAEILPGDRLRLEAVVVDTEGRRLPEHELETLWVQCGRGPCDQWWGVLGLSDWVFDVRCDALEVYTTDDFCVLGTGSGAFEFEIPELGPYVLYGNPPWLSMFAVVAWDGRSAEDCWDSRRGDLTNLDRCGFIYHDVTIGPIWWLYGYATQLGFELPYEGDPAVFPAAVFTQPANRIPKTPTLQIVIDGQEVAAGVPPFEPIPVDPGASIEVAFAFDPLSQLFQSSFKPLSYFPSNAFKVVPEQLISRTATSGAIIQRGALEPVIGDGSFSYEVDALTEPGISRVLIGYRDGRGANDLVTLEFEHE